MALSEIGVSDELAKNTIRVSFGTDNSKVQIDQFIEIWKNLYQKTKK